MLVPLSTLIALGPLIPAEVIFCLQVRPKMKFNINEQDWGVCHSPPRGRKRPLENRNLTTLIEHH
jgi:hypothetical protein